MSSIQIGQIFPLTVDYRQTAEEMIACETVSMTLLNHITLPEEHSGKIVLYDCQFLEAGISTEEAFQRARKLHSKLARFEHGCAFARKYPQEQCLRSILLLGTSNNIQQGTAEKAAVLDADTSKDKKLAKGPQVVSTLSENALSETELHYAFKEAHHEWPECMRILIVRKTASFTPEAYADHLTEIAEALKKSEALNKREVIVGS